MTAARSALRIVPRLDDRQNRLDRAVRVAARMNCISVANLGEELRRLGSRAPALWLIRLLFLELP